jgi:hypothetical protein
MFSLKVVLVVERTAHTVAEIALQDIVVEKVESG